jgi:signal transduction histidine kinase
MGTSAKNMKIKNSHLNAGFAFVIILVLILPAFSAFNLVKLSENTAQLRDREFLFMKICGDIEVQLVKKVTKIQQLGADAKTREKELLIKELNALEKHILNQYEQLCRIADSEQDKAFLASFKEQYRQFNLLKNDLIARLGVLQEQEIFLHTEQLQDRLIPLTLAIQEIRNSKINYTIDYFNTMEASASDHMMWMFILSFMLLLFILALGYYFSGIRNKIITMNKLLRLKILEKKKAEQEIRTYSLELKEMNNRKNKLISLLSHDLRSPATGLLGAAQFLHGNVDQMEKSEIKKFTQVIINSGTRLVEQLNETLIWIRSQSVKEEFNPVKLNIRKTIDKIEKQLEENIVQKNLYFFNDSSPDHTICSDQTMFESIIRNLVSNAIKFTPAKGEIRVTSNVEGECITIRVSDTGVGMSEEKKEELFKKSVESTGGTSNEKGSGIGLMLIKEFMDKHKGEIEIDSTPGKGTVVTLKFKSSGSGIC